jgi:cyanate permease
MTTFFRGTYSLSTSQKYDLTPKQNGFLMSYFGLLEVFTQGFLIPQLSRRFSEFQIIESANILYFVSILGMIVLKNFYFFLVLLIPVVVSSGIMKTCLVSAVTKQLEADEVGRILGVLDSISSITLIISPTLIGYLLQWNENIPMMIILLILIIFGFVSKKSLVKIY